jgi:hypothetical protein
MERGVLRMRLTITVMSVVLILIVACKKQEPKPEFKATTPVREIMGSMVVPSSEILFNAVSSSITPKGTEEIAPKADEDWQEVRNRAITILEASDLLLIPGRNIAGPGKHAKNPSVQLEPEEIERMVSEDWAGWTKMTHDFHDSILPALKAIDEKNPAALSDSTLAIDKACESCHLKFWYPEPKEKGAPQPPKP